MPCRRRCRSSLIQPILVDLCVFAAPHARLRCPCGLTRVEHFLAVHASGNMVFTLGLRHTAVVCSSLTLVVQSLAVQTPFASFRAVS